MKMCCVFIFLFLLSCSSSSISTKQIGTPFDDKGLSIANDKDGNVFITGDTFGGFDKNIGKNDILLIKYNKDKELLFTKQFGTPLSDSGNSIATDGNGDIFITGYVEGSFNENVYMGKYDAFLTKYNNNGDLLWSKQWGTIDWDIGKALTTDNENNIYVIGITTNSFDKNAKKIYNDIFLTKYNSNGDFIWTKQLSNKNGDEGNYIDIDYDGNIYVSGFTNGSKNNNYDIYLIKLDKNGEFLWTKQWGTPLNDISYDVKVTQSGYIYITGVTNGNMDGRNGCFGNCKTYPNTTEDMFLIKLNSNGEKQWVRQFGKSSYDAGKSLIIDEEENIFVSGHTNNISAEKGSGYDIFLAKYNSNGDFQWIEQFGSSSDDTCSLITIDNNKNIYIIGDTYGTFDGNNNTGGSDIFLTIFNE